jgi:hypothetical protein
MPRRQVHGDLGVQQAPGEEGDDVAGMVAVQLGDVIGVEGQGSVLQGGEEAGV